jgi:hypothetical protein
MQKQILDTNIIKPEKLTNKVLRNAISTSMDRYFTDEFYGKQLGRLFKAGKIDSIKLQRDITDDTLDEMKKTLRSFDFGVLNVITTGTGKMLLIVVPDGQVIAKALDMVAKLKGWYAPDKIELSQPATITGMRIIDISQKKLEDLKQLESIKNDMQQLDDGVDTIYSDDVIESSVTIDDSSSSVIL